MQVASQTASQDEERMRDMPVPGQSGKESEDLAKLERFWNDRLTYPTGRFNPAWLRNAAAQHARMPSGVPAGKVINSFSHLKQAQQGKGPLRQSSGPLGQASAPDSLSTASFTALGPAPEHMTGCSGCFDYGKTEGRTNAIVVDPTTTTNGSIVAYAGTVGGGVWKTTNCCSSSTTWAVTTDDPLISTTAIDTLTIDPNNHNTIYAGTGDLNYGSFSMGSQGILKSTNGGATWTVLGSSVFGPDYTEPAGNYFQYNAVGKVRVDPNNSQNVVAGTKQGIYLSRDGGVSWTQCPANAFSTQRQDITGLELTNMGGGVTRVLAAIGVRGFPTFVQYDLGSNGANGIYSATMPASGCPTFNSIASNANGFVFGTAVTGSPYTTGANMNAGTGTPCNYPYLVAGSATFCGGASPADGGANNLGRIDIGVAPSDPNTIYAQVGSIDWNNNTGSSTGCGNTTGCQLGAWMSTNGGATWSFMAGSAGGSLRSCGSSGNANGSNAGDYPQNWYDQAVAVDPNDPTRVFFDTLSVYYATQSGSTWYDTSCAYTQTGLGMHADQHVLTFVPGSSSIMLAAGDGGIDATANANVASLNTARPTWFNMDNGLNTIEFYAGDISGNFANSATPAVVAGAQDNGPSSAQFSGSPTGPVQWQMGTGGDGFSGQID
ncbi:MAG TPA: sialidase family protein, partial [Bryobacteraceae bacterium]